jgi:hypothetical protein
MDLAFQLTVLLLLGFIAFEIASLKSEIARLPVIVRQAEDKKESPTINVNVGTMPVQAAKEEASREAAAEPALPAADSAEADQPESEPELEIEEPVPEVRRPTEAVHRAIDVNATPSGLMAVKCPACQAENSSYRSECFNCGAPLH